MPIRLRGGFARLHYALSWRQTRRIQHSQEEAIGRLVESYVPTVAGRSDENIFRYIFRSLEWWGALLGGDAIIDVGENYVKQSARNRAEILSASGVMPLTVNVVKGASIHKKPMREMRIDYSKRWQHLHRTAIRSAYRNSPYYDYFAERFEPLYCRRYDFLYDFDRDSLLAAAIYGCRQRLLRFSGGVFAGRCGRCRPARHDFLGRAPLETSIRSSPTVCLLSTIFGADPYLLRGARRPALTAIKNRNSLRVPQWWRCLSRFPTRLNQVASAVRTTLSQRKTPFRPLTLSLFSPLM